MTLIALMCISSALYLIWISFPLSSVVSLIKHPFLFSIFFLQKTLEYTLMRNLWRDRTDRLKKDIYIHILSIHIVCIYKYIEYTPNIFGMCICIYMHTCMCNMCSVHKNIYDLLDYIINCSPDCSTKAVYGCKAEESRSCSV